MICRFCKKDIGGDDFIAFCRDHEGYLVMHFTTAQSFSVCKGKYEIEVSLMDNFTTLRSHELITSSNPSFVVRQYSHNGVYYGDYGDPLLKINIAYDDLSPSTFDKYFDKFIKLVPFS